MPELPEVETIVRGLRPELKGLRFLGAEIFNINSVIVSEELASDEAFEMLKSKKILQIERRGKFINIFFEGNFVLTIHLRMTGRVILKNDDDSGDFLKFVRVRLDFEGKSLFFCDVRKFGKIWVCKKNNYENITGISRLGLEPLGNEFDPGKWRELVAGRRGNVKSFLLNQTFIAGVGNIYADESLFYARIRPQRDLSSLSANEKERLFEGIRCSLNKGIENCGTSFSDFVDTRGKKGLNQELLFVYGRGGEKCLRCESILEKSRVAGRGTVFCAKCQN